TSGSLLASNSVAEPNILTLRPTELSRAASEVRKSGSSSTRKTICCSAAASIGDERIAAGPGRTSESEAASPTPANDESSMVLSWRAFIEEPPFHTIKQSFVSNSYLRRHWLRSRSLQRSIACSQGRAHTCLPRACVRGFAHSRTPLEVRVEPNPLDGTYGTRSPRVAARFR